MEKTIAALEALYTELNIPNNPAGDTFRSLGKMIEFSKGEKLPLYRGEEGLLYILLQGCTCCEAETPDGRAVLECICYRPYEAVNPVGMFTGEASLENCVCLTDSFFAVFPFSAVTELVQSDMEMMSIYSRCLKDALGEQTRHKYMLSLRSEEKYEWFLKYYGEVAESIPMRIVAQFLNLDPATLSRVRGKKRGAAKHSVYKEEKSKNTQ